MRIKESSLSEQLTGEINKQSNRVFACSVALSPASVHSGSQPVPTMVTALPLFGCSGRTKKVMRISYEKGRFSMVRRSLVVQRTIRQLQHRSAVAHLLE